MSNLLNAIANAELAAEYEAAHQASVSAAHVSALSVLSECAKEMVVGNADQIYWYGNIVDACRRTLAEDKLEEVAWASEALVTEFFERTPSKRMYMAARDMLLTTQYFRTVTTAVYREHLIATGQEVPDNGDTVSIMAVNNFFPWRTWQDEWSPDADIVLADETLAQSLARHLSYTRTPIGVQERVLHKFLSELDVSKKTGDWYTWHDDPRIRRAIEDWACWRYLL